MYELLKSSEGASATTRLQFSQHGVPGKEHCKEPRGMYQCAAVKTVCGPMSAPEHEPSKEVTWPICRASAAVAYYTQYGCSWCTQAEQLAEPQISWRKACCAAWAWLPQGSTHSCERVGEECEAQVAATVGSGGRRVGDSHAAISPINQNPPPSVIGSGGVRNGMQRVEAWLRAREATS